MPEAAEMIRPDVGWSLPDGSYREVAADRAVYTNGVWTFFSSATNVIETEQSSQTAPPIRVLVTNVLAMPEFKETPRDIERDLRFSKSDDGRLQVAQTEHPAGGALGVSAGASDDLPRDEARKWRTKFDGRLAAPWTCLVVVLIAIPFGAASGRRNLFFGVAGSIFICFAFFVVQQVSLALGSGGYLPAVAGGLAAQLGFRRTGTVPDGARAMKL